MQLKKLALPLLVAVGIMSAHADGLYLHIQEKNGNWTVLDLEQIDKLTFASNTMAVSDANGNVVKSFPSSSLETMNVNETELSGIQDITSREEEGLLCVDGHQLKVKADGTLSIYDMKGRLCVRINNIKDGESVNLSALPAGIYIASVNDYTRKFNLK